MNITDNINFNRIASAIEYIKNNSYKQPSLEEIAAHINVSPTHFQKIFTAWAGISPKKFVQYTTLNYAKSKLQNNNTTLFETTVNAGLSGTSRLHDLFVNIEAMTPGQYKNDGENLQINYDYASTIFGEIIIASTTIGICYIAFYENKVEAFLLLQQCFPKAKYTQKETDFITQVIYYFQNNFTNKGKIKLHIKGTPFQIKVWEALLTIPNGSLQSYGTIANKIHYPKASRAVGTAIGNNPIAFIIPCHRVIQATGLFGNYMWGAKRKTAIIGWEAAH
ncbi:MAG: methylated-DNA--[protein]-cysteine S-methyltransferase [Ferruginibacter sp.]|nr:methylated-DNA--[protein]-cysteine S-methyltransferase [Ferruginibacter sp.]